MNKHLMAKSLALTTLIFFASACGDDSSAPADGGARDGVIFVDLGPTNDTGLQVDSGGSDDMGGTADASDASPSDSGSDVAGACSVWEITYDLTGSLFEIADTPFGAGNQVNTLTTPYDADNHVGPGSITLRFQDVGGGPGGLAAISSYTMAIHFVVDGVTKVATDLDATAGPELCGVTTGNLQGSTVAWNPSALVGHRTVGQLLCTGSLCGFGGLPNGDPVPIDETVDQPLSDFVFTGDLNSFTMEKTVVAQDNNSTTTWQFEGTETGRQLVASPACLCP